MEQNYKVQPFDLNTALANPDWVHFRSGEKPLEWHWFKTTKADYSIMAVFPKGETGSFAKNGSYYTDRQSESDLVIHVPVKKMKITVFVWPDGCSISFSESAYKGSSYYITCQQAEQGKCTRHEFEVEVNN